MKHCDSYSVEMLRTALAIFLCAAPSFAHDFWIDPSAWRLDAKKALLVHLRVGEHFVGDAVPRNDAMIERFSIVRASGEQRIAGAPNAVPAGTIPASRDEAAVLLYRSKRSAVELDAAKFEQYLREEGLEKIIAERKRRGESSRKGREVFSRSIKSILGARAADKTKLWSRNYGMTLELIPKHDPRDPSKPFRATLQHRGKPLAGALVVAMHRRKPLEKITARTAADGSVQLPLARGGEWLVKAVQMDRISENVAEWESVWTSLTFNRD